MYGWLSAAGTSGMLYGYGERSRQGSGHDTIYFWRCLLLACSSFVLVGILASPTDAGRGSTDASSNSGLFIRSLMIYLIALLKIALYVMDETWVSFVGIPLE